MLLLGLWWRCLRPASQLFCWSKLLVWSFQESLTQFLTSRQTEQYPLPVAPTKKILVKMSKLKKVVNLLQIQCSNWLLFLPLLLKLVIDISASLCLLWNLTEKKSFWQILVMAVNVKWTFLLLFATFSSILQHKNGKKFSFNSHMILQFGIRYIWYKCHLST